MLSTRSLGCFAASLLLMVGCSPEERESGQPNTGGVGGSSTSGGSSGFGGSSGSTSGGSAGSGGSTSGGSTSGGSTSGGSTSGGQGGSSGATGGSAGDAGSGGVGGDAGASGSGGASGSAGTGGSGGSLPTCTGECVSPAPADWDGPFAAALGSPAPACPTDYPNAALSAHRDSITGAATCACDCTKSGVSCGDPSAVWRISCGQPIGSVTLGPPNTCTDTTPGHNSASYTWPNLSGSCQPTGKATKPAVQWNTTINLCGGTDLAESCPGAQICMPDIAAPFGNLCVSRAGEWACPPGYLDREIYYTGVSDTRGCSSSQCTCETATCSADATRYTTSGCGGTATSVTIATTTCASSFNSIRYSTPTVACASGGTSAATGSVMGTNAVTVCCR